MTGEMATVRLATARLAGMVHGEKTEYAYSTAGYFRTDQGLGSTPTLYISLTSTDGRPVENFYLEEVRYYLDVNGGTHTYQLYLLEATSADDVQNKSDIVFDSGASQAEATSYTWIPQGHATTTSYQLPRLVKLTVQDRLYYMIDWSAAPTSSVQGYIKVRGRPLLA